MNCLLPIKLKLDSLFSQLAPMSILSAKYWLLVNDIHAVGLDPLSVSECLLKKGPLTRPTL